MSKDTASITPSLEYSSSLNSMLGVPGSPWRVRPSRQATETQGPTAQLNKTRCGTGNKDQV